jgi:hypothetical protein
VIQHPSAVATAPSTSTSGGGASAKNGSGAARGRKRAGNFVTINYSNVINYSCILLYNTHYSWCPL